MRKEDGEAARNWAIKENLAEKFEEADPTNSGKIVIQAILSSVGAMYGI